MSFRYPWVLILLPAVLWLLYRALSLGGARRILQFPLAHRQLAINANLQLPIWLPYALRAAAFALLLAALARPQTYSSEIRRSSEGIDIMIALDVSLSMTIEDVGEAGTSRIAAAKETIHHFIEGRKDDRIGFLQFAGEPVTLSPPTLDYDFLHSAVNMADVNQLKDGTAIGDGLATAVNRLKDSTAKSRIVILATDGDNNMGAIAPLTAGDIAAGYGIKVYTIAMGSEGMVNVPEGKDIFGRTVYRQEESTINPELLMKIAAVTNGKFFRATDHDAMQRIFAEIDKLERSKVEKKEKVLWDEHFQPLVLLALLLLLADIGLRSTIFRVLPE